MLFMPFPKKSRIYLQRQIFFSFFWCMGIFGLQEENNLSYRLLLLYFVVLICLTLFTLILRVHKEDSRALVFIGLWLIPIILISILYYVRITEYLSYFIYGSVVNTGIISLIIALVSIRWMYALYVKQKSYLALSYSAGLLKKFNIFDKENGVFNPNIYYPGLDGTSPDEMNKRDYSKWAIITALPLSGLTFIFLRTTTNSIIWILFFLCIYVFIGLIFLGAKTFAVWVQVSNWEKSVGKKIRITLIEQ